MLGEQTRTDPFHIGVVRTPLTRNLGYRFAEVKDEILEVFGEMIPPTGGMYILLQSMNLNRYILTRVDQDSYLFDRGANSL